MREACKQHSPDGSLGDGRDWTVVYACLTERVTAWIEENPCDWD